MPAERDRHDDNTADDADDTGGSLDRDLSVEELAEGVEELFGADTKPENVPPAQPDAPPPA